MSSGAGVGVFVVGEVESLSLSCGFWGTEEVDAGTERRNEEDQGPNRPDDTGEIQLFVHWAHE